MCCPSCGGCSYFATPGVDYHAWSAGLLQPQACSDLYPYPFLLPATFEEGAFLHQHTIEAKSVVWWISTLHENVARDAHVQLQVEFPVRGATPGRCSLCVDQVGIQRILPLDYSTMHLPPLVGISCEEVPKGSQIAVLPLNSPVVAAIKEMEVSALSMQSNVEVSLVSCACGEFHVSLCATTALCKGDILVPLNSCPPRILVQFDGSAHRGKKIGGGSAALLQVESTGVSLRDWGASALPNCPDNIVAETHGADLAINLYEKYRSMCHLQSMSPLPLDRFQGDIKPLPQHLDFRGRFRRNDLVRLINQFHAKRSRVAPGSITEYRPREANALADYFAGYASAFLWDLPETGMSVESPVEVQCDPPYDLLLQANAVIVGPHQDGKTVLILQERPGCDLVAMARFAQWMDGKYAGKVREIALATRQGQVPTSVEYLASSLDGEGRLYARHTCAQTLPRSLRLLLYGATHKEVDISGAIMSLYVPCVPLVLCPQSANCEAGYNNYGPPGLSLPTQQLSS